MIGSPDVDHIEEWCKQKEAEPEEGKEDLKYQLHS